MRLTHLLVGLALCLTPMLGCGGGSSGPGTAVTNQSEIEKFLAENPDLNDDAANEGTEYDDDE